MGEKLSPKTCNSFLNQEFDGVKIFPPKLAIASEPLILKAPPKLAITQLLRFHGQKTFPPKLAIAF
jgi:hypothetical protein